MRAEAKIKTGKAKTNNKPMKKKVFDLNNSPVEQRVMRFEAGTLEVRSADGDKLPTLVGYAAKFDKRADLGWYQEEIAPGAFAESLRRGDDVRALWNHNTSAPLGRRSAGTLRVSEDATGLRVEIDLPNTTAGKDVLESVTRGDVDGMSFGFRAQRVEWQFDPEDGSNDVRRLLEVDLIEVSAVTFPAYEDTEIAKRSEDAVRKEISKLTDVRSAENRPAVASVNLETLRLRHANRKRRYK